ncbi:hypothetical protein [Streptomyces sp. NPDC055056]
MFDATQRTVAGGVTAQTHRGHLRSSLRARAAARFVVGVRGGRHDKIIGADRLLAWRAFTTHFGGLEAYEGDHFYLSTTSSLSLRP